ncbi:ParA family protein [Lacihabitans soyangensis]|uniref:ParA family protein n=2 Tax=Lacihabitans soyangensis TaxID=869394 RepID=A0AAE3KX39_9BACT|nr:ParA family protein [Lacihabitans soyangensis]MCP9764035.1 ParA family protein [Lacihabitans soyangensis]
MKIITIAHQKGGVGKTSLALNIAYCLKHSLRVAVLDSDPQGSISGLGEYVGLKGLDLVPIENLGKVQNQYDVAIIDTPPYLSTLLPDFFELSDYVLIPTKAGVLDVMAIKATIQLLIEAQKKHPNLKAGIVLNMIQKSTSLTDDIKELLLQYKMPIHQTMIHQRVSYARSPLTGGVFDTDDDKAKEEILSLCKEILANF